MTASVRTCKIADARTKSTKPPATAASAADQGPQAQRPLVIPPPRSNPKEEWRMHDDLKTSGGERPKRHRERGGLIGTDHGTEGRAVQEHRPVVIWLAGEIETSQPSLRGVMNEFEGGE